MVYIALDEQIARELQQLASARAIETSTLAQQAIREFLRTEARRAMQREAEAFRQLHAELLEKIPDHYAAIYQGKLVDHDPDQLALFLRIEKQYADLLVLIRQVRPTVEETINVRSPRFEYA